MSLWPLSTKSVDFSLPSALFTYFYYIFLFMYVQKFYFYNIYFDLTLLHKNSHNLFHSLGIFKISILVNCSEFDLTGYIFLKFHLIEKKNS